MFRSIILFTAFLILASGSAFAQGDYLDDGESAIEGHIGYADVEDYSGLGWGVGGSVLGRFDLGVTRYYLKSGGSEGDILSPYVTFHIIKGEYPHKPLSVSFQVGGDFSEDHGNWKNTGKNIGGVFHSDLKLGNDMFVKPVVGTGISRHYITHDHWESDAFFLVGLYFHQRSGERRQMIVSVGPQANFSDGIATILISFALSYSWPPR